MEERRTKVLPIIDIRLPLPIIEIKMIVCIVSTFAYQINSAFTPAGSSKGTREFAFESFMILANRTPSATAVPILMIRCIVPTNNKVVKATGSP